MAKEETIEGARRAEREGKSASTQGGEFVREEIEAIRKGEHGARSTKQAIAIGLSKARRAGVRLPVPEKGSVPKKRREHAKRELAEAEKGERHKPSRKRSRATFNALKREGRGAASDSGGTCLGPCKKAGRPGTARAAQGGRALGDPVLEAKLALVLG
jgi:hypothetical protein